MTDSQVTPKELQPQFLFITDLDHTFVGDADALRELQALLRQHRQAYGTKIVYATGRSPQLYRQLKAEQSLINPDALVTSVGTEIYYQDPSDVADREWSAILAPGWNREIVAATAAEFAELVPQPESEQRPFKLSYYISPELAAGILPKVESILQQQGLKVKLVYSGGKDLDFLPEKGNKGLAMQFLGQHWGISPERTVACGDSGNDIALFSVGSEKGIIVGNAKSELRQWYAQNRTPEIYLAQANYARGIVEGLKYFGFL
ncbi:MAG TPA: sucrose-phosphate phosphatase [Oscillatoriaceae cyanobacterium M33_DOE_052]|uniref:sucrose-phosphate phosphatase n=1 Tax=Planktothricoides sp. SpSt-374 TaxID=2282167 RepID=A0A7C3VFZ2_9CYAN|nr:sucrose-phosphate phosphatase [Oscillatoriaceae cyanobacterium M33_DOE_052]